MNSVVPWNWFRDAEVRVPAPASRPAIIALDAVKHIAAATTFGFAAALYVKNDFEEDLPTEENGEPSIIPVKGLMVIGAFVLPIISGSSFAIGEAIGRRIWESKTVSLLTGVAATTFPCIYFNTPQSVFPAVVVGGIIPKVMVSCAEYAVKSCCMTRAAMAPPPSQTGDTELEPLINV